MKNSLFKRAFATVAAVPVALAQCLTIANAVEVSDASAAAVAEDVTVITLNGENGLLSIAPAGDYASVGDGTYEKISDWNTRVAGIISQAGSGSFDASEIIAEAVARSGRFKEMAELVADKVGVINYAVNPNGDMVVTADVDNLAPAFEEIAQKLIDDVVADIVIEYDEQQEVIDELKSTKFFSNVEIAGTVKAVITTADLATGTTVSAQISFTDSEGNVYTNVNDVKAYALAKIAEVKAAAKGSLKKIADKYDLSEEEIEQKIEESQDYKDLIERYSQPVTLTPEEVEAAARVSDDYKKLVADLVAKGMTEEAAKAQVEDSQDYKDLIVKYSQKEIRLTREEVEAAVKKSEDYKNKVEEIKADYAEQFGILVDKLNSTESKIDELVDGYAGYLAKAENAYDKAQDFSAQGTYADSAALLAAAKNRLAKTRYSRFADRVPSTFEEGASKNLVAELFTAVVNQINSSVKSFDVQVDSVEIGKYFDTFQNIEASVSDLVASANATYPDSQEADVKAYFVENYGIDETDFSSHMEVSAVADFSDAVNGVVSVDFQLKRVVKAVVPETTTTTTETTTTTTTTSTSTTATTTVTTVTTTDDSFLTTTTTTEEAPITTTTTTEEAPITTTTSTTEVAPIESSTTTTTTEPVTVTERAASVKNITCTVQTAFYLNIEDEYDIDQVVNIYADVQNQILIKNEAGEVIEIVNDTNVETLNLKGKINYGDQKPSDSTANSVMDARNITVYASEDVTNSYGVKVLSAGEVLVNSNGERITVPAYVGVKGDIDLNGAADASDASQVLYIYAKLQSGAEPDEIQFSSSAAVTSANDILDQFAAFLADVDAEDEIGNHFTFKADRAVDASDASYILAAYAKAQTTGTDIDRDMWDDVLNGTVPETEE